MCCSLRSTLTGCGCVSFSDGVRVRFLRLGLLVSALALASAPLALARSWVIQADTAIGGYLVKKDGTLFGALRQFGEPTRMRRDKVSGWNGCDVTWRQLGLKIYFYNLGGRGPCKPQFGYFRDALITGKNWRTASGLRIGDPMRSIWRYHPKAKPPLKGSWWSLVMRPWPYGDGGTYAGLAAKVNNGKVSAFSVYFQAGGE